MSSVDAAGAVKPNEGAWEVLETKFRSYLAPKMVDEHERLSSCDSFAHSKNHQAVISEDHNFTTGGCIALPGASSYIAGLQFGHHDGAWGIHATVVTLEGDGKMTVTHNVAPGQMAALTNKKGARLYSSHHGRWTHVGGMTLGMAEIPERPLPPPGRPGVPASHNCMYVVSGFNLQELGGALVFALQFSEMRVGLDGKVSIVDVPSSGPPFVAPTKLRETFKVTKDIDQLHCDVSGTASYAPLTNASFQRINKYQVSLRTRIICPYRADVFQPMFLQQFSMANMPYTAPAPAATGGATS